MKRLIFKLLIAKFIVLFFIVTSCHVNTQQVNNVQDKDEATKVVGRFFMYFHDNRYHETYPLLGKKMLAVTDTAKFGTFLRDMTKKYGKIKEYKLKSCETSIISGTDPVSIYKVVYQNNYENGKVEEEFLLEKENDVIKINGYHVNSETF